MQIFRLLPRLAAKNAALFTIRNRAAPTASTFLRPFSPLANSFSTASCRCESKSNAVVYPEPPVQSLPADKSSSIPRKEEHHAVVSTFDLFSIGIGPSSSHTVGPMRAAKIFIGDLKGHNVLEKVHSLRIDLFGSLALTGVGHSTPDAILMGIEGETPEKVETSTIRSRIADIHANKSIHLNGTHRICFDPAKQLVFNYFQNLPQHPNGMRFCVYDKQGDLVATNEYFSIGGGFVVNDETQLAHGENVYYKGINKKAVSEQRARQDVAIAALPFRNAEELLQVCRREDMTIAQVVYENELKWRTREEIRDRIMAIWKTMDESIKNGVLADENEMLPGKLNIPRRAPKLYKKLLKGLYGAGPTPSFNTTQLSPPSTSSSSLTPSDADTSPSRSKTPISLTVLPKRPAKRLFLPALDYLSVYAIAVNEENASGGRVVTAPTNGAAGTIPSVLKYYLEFISENPERDVMEFLLTTAAIGMLYKRGASISAAEMGCQGEVGVACSMAAAGFASVMGGTVEQVENAAEIGMLEAKSYYGVREGGNIAPSLHRSTPLPETIYAHNDLTAFQEHNLGLTCDPIAGLVQVPCIERNALAAVKAIAAAQLALNGEGTHRVSLDQVIETMRQTGVDMMSKYKETSQGGLAVNVPVC